MNIPEGLPLLSTGHHERGSGSACIMDAISYISGDKNVTDSPACVYPVLANMAQGLNDSICSHSSNLQYGGPRALCSECSHKMWMIGQRLVGSQYATEGQDLAVLNTRLATAAARSVLHLTGELREISLTAIKAAELWIRVAGTSAAAAAAVVAEAAAVVAEAAARAAWPAGSCCWAAWLAAGAAEAAAGAAAGAAEAAWLAAGAARAAGAAEAAAGRRGGAREVPLLAVIAEFEKVTGFNSGKNYGPAEYSLVASEAKVQVAS